MLELAVFFMFLSWGFIELVRYVIRIKIVGSNKKHKHKTKDKYYEEVFGNNNKEENCDDIEKKLNKIKKYLGLD